MARKARRGIERRASLKSHAALTTAYAAGLWVADIGSARACWRLARPRVFLFPGCDENRPLDPTVLHAACRSPVKAAGLTKRVTRHTLRS